MPRMLDTKLMAILAKHAENILRVRTVSFSREVYEYRERIRAQLLDRESDLLTSLRKIRNDARQRAESAGKQDLSLYEYYRAICAEASFLLTAFEGTTNKNRSPVSEKS